VPFIALCCLLKVVSSGKACLSRLNHAAYKRQNGRQGSPTVPFILPAIAYDSKRPVPDSLPFRLAFHQPATIVKIPFNRRSLQSWYSQGTLTQDDLHVVHGCYLRLEQEAQTIRMERFEQGEKFYLIRDINNEIQSACREWKALWKKQLATEVQSDDNAYEALIVHSQWTARTVEHLKEELHLLGSVHRLQEYVGLIKSRIINVPLPESTYIDNACPT
jgi:hypothetical protein